VCWFVDHYAVTELALTKKLIKFRAVLKSKYPQHCMKVASRIQVIIQGKTRFSGIHSKKTTETYRRQEGKKTTRQNNANASR
jgi:hypothetical protein